MKTLTMKLPDGLLGWLENEAKRARQPKSALVRQILQQHQQRRRPSALDLAADLCGCVQSGLRDLARNKKHFLPAKRRNAECGRRKAELGTS